MGELRNLINPLHRATRREYLPRMQDEKVHCMQVAKQYGPDYWDGDRRYGYGGYRYDGRWKAVAEALIATYDLKADASILDVGCGKAFLLYELQQLLPQARIAGFDISGHGINDARSEVREMLFIHRAEDPYPFGDGEFDLVLSLNCLHNLPLPSLHRALWEMERVGRHKYLCVESYRNEQEQFNLQCWALTCEAFFDTQSWVWLFDHCGYTGDYEFIFFE